ncbi:FkbM family methyltransferase [Pseudomonadota bacterium]
MLINLSNLCEKYSIRPEGVLHIGAHLGEERSDYESCGFKKVVWIEANPELANSLSDRFASSERAFESEIVLTAAISEVENETASFFVTNNFQSSSLRKFGLHQLFYPDIKVNKTITVSTRRIDGIFDCAPELAEGLTFANLDIQGMELEAIQGFGKYLEQFEWIYTEVNRSEVYRGNSLVWDIDLYLLHRGFVRVETNWTPNDWGDAFYNRCKLSVGYQLRESLRLRMVKNGFGLINALKRVKRGLKRRLRRKQAL